MDEKPGPDRPVDSPQTDGAAGSDPVLDWAPRALEEVHKAANKEADTLQRQRAYLEQIERDIAGKSPSDAQRIVGSYLEGESDPDVRRVLEHMMDALQYREGHEREREAAFRGTWGMSRILAAGLAAVVLAAVMVVSVLAGAGELSCAPGEPTPDSSVAVTEPAPAEGPQTESGSQSPGGGDPYLEARAVLGLSTTTPASVEHMNTGAGPMVYELSWVDRAEAPRVELGSIGIVTLAEDRAMQEGGRATLDGSDPAGAYVVGKAEGQLHIGVRMAIRVPGPDGGEPQLLVFDLENTEGSSLVGTARPAGGADPDPPWYVFGERR